MYKRQVSLPFAIEIINQFIETKSNLENNQPQKQNKIVLNGQLLRVYEGKYAAFGQIMNVTAKNHKLKGRIGNIGLDLIPVNETEFRLTHWMDK